MARIFYENETNFPVFAFSRVDDEPPLRSGSIERFLRSATLSPSPLHSSLGPSNSKRFRFAFVRSSSVKEKINHLNLNGRHIEPIK